MMQAAAAKQQEESCPVDPIVIRGLSRRFGETEALRSLDMSVKQGDIYGFLGRNGAGKTTAFRILAGLIRPGAGTVRILGRSATQRDPTVRRCVGFLVETPAFFPYLNAFDNLRCHAYLAGGVDRKEIEKNLDLFGLSRVARRRVGGYSLGMRQRLGLAQAFLGDPDILILDEPSVGLDAEGVIEVREIIRDRAVEKGTTFLISSHILGEMERLCTRIGVVESGRMMAEGTLAELGATGRVTIRTSDPGRAAVLINERFAGALQESPAAVPDGSEALPAGCQDGKLLASLSEEEIPVAVRLFVEAGLDVHEISFGPATLEDLFLHLVRGDDEP